MTPAELAAIRKRDSAAYRDSGYGVVTVGAAQADRRALLAHVDELKALLREAKCKIECINCDGDWLCDACADLVGRIEEAAHE